MLDLRIQYWTSRGIAVVDVNYGGSTGYGRAYRDRLRRAWDIVDVDDCINAAKYLARRRSVDRKRSVMTGGSAGGYTTLAALTFRKYFAGGASIKPAIHVKFIFDFQAPPTSSWSFDGTCSARQLLSLSLIHI